MPHTYWCLPAKQRITANIIMHFYLNQNTLRSLSQKRSKTFPFQKIRFPSSSLRMETIFFMYFEDHSKCIPNMRCQTERLSTVKSPPQGPSWVIFERLWSCLKSDSFGTKPLCTYTCCRSLMRTMEGRSLWSMLEMWFCRICENLSGSTGLYTSYTEWSTSHQTVAFTLKERRA